MIYLGNNKIGTIYSGENKIDKIYKGEELIYSSDGIPSHYVLATDDDFQAIKPIDTTVLLFRYIGNAEYVIIPRVIQGRSGYPGGYRNYTRFGTYYYGMFDSKSPSTVKGIATKRGHIISTQYMFYENNRQSAIEKTYFNRPAK